MTAVSTDLDFAVILGFAVIWRANEGDRWHVQPYLWPSAAATALATRLVVQGGGEAFCAPIGDPSRLVTVRVCRD